MPSSYNSSTTKPLYKATLIIWYLLGLVEFLLAIRFILKMLGGNTGSGFVAIIYSLSQALAAPFFNILPTTKVGGISIEWTTLLAMVIYWFIAWALARLMLISRSVSTPEAAERLHEQEDKSNA